MNAYYQHIVARKQFFVKLTKKKMELTSYDGFKRVEKSVTPTSKEIEDGALVLYTNGYLETIIGHIRFFDKRHNGTMEWTAGSSDDVTDLVDCWFRKEK
jgi:hypothetical protein